MADRIDELKLAEGIYIEGELLVLIAEMHDNIEDMFETYFTLMMQKGILFATEHMNRLSPKYHFEAGWQPADDKLLANLLNGARKYLTNLTGDLAKKASQEIRDGVEEGKSIEEIGADVATVIEASKRRGTLIARTELMRAWNQTAYDSYIKAGFGAAWMTARDPIVCERCEPLDGKHACNVVKPPPARTADSQANRLPNAPFHSTV